MSSWVQRYQLSSTRQAVPHVTNVTAEWAVDMGWIFFEGRTSAQAARGTHESERWVATTVWGPEERADVENFLSLLRDAVQQDDKRLEIHLEPLNGQFVDAVVMATEIPQQIGSAQTNVVITFERVSTP